MAELDNSAANILRDCPLEHYNSYLREGTGLELQPYGGTYTPLELGSRMHELWEEYYCELKGTPRIPYPESPNEALEVEAQIIINAYKAKYPQEEFIIDDVERPFRVALPLHCPECYELVQDVPNADGEYWCNFCNAWVFPGLHVYTGKIDVLYHYPDSPDVQEIMDHKTEKRRSNSNLPQKWAARDQASLYLWAARALYPGKQIGRFTVNVAKRPSEKLQEPPIFPERQTLERTESQIMLAVRDLCWLGDQLDSFRKKFGDRVVWPSNREHCHSGWGQCDFYLPCTYGWSEEIRREKYQPKSDYQKLGGIPIIQP